MTLKMYIGKIFVDECDLDFPDFTETIRGRKTFIEEASQAMYEKNKQEVIGQRRELHFYIHHSSRVCEDTDVPPWATIIKKIGSLEANEKISDLLNKLEK